MSTSKTHRDPLALIDEWCPVSDAEKLRREEEYAELEVAHLLHKVRTAAGLTQAQLAERIGTKAPAISRLEDARYEGHSLAMLRRVAKALGKRVVVQLVDDPSAAGVVQEVVDEGAAA